MIVATAGHIDHGKTTLVKVLTGVDTDRLPEEKSRGISIDLGFAYWKASVETGVLAFVDVPGHERFVRNMLAGVCGVDYVMLIVAADDGAKPQTVEHLNIVHLLGLARGIAVVTKIDRVSSARVEEVTREVTALVAPTSLAGIDVVPVSAITGQGLEAVRAKLAVAGLANVRRTRDGRLFRFAIDRVFTVAGAGTVVTGTVFDGTVNPGDRLLLSPAGTEVRVRGIQKDSHPADSAVAGERCALNLSALKDADMSRGDWAIHPALHAPVQRMDVRILVLATEFAPLRHWTPVHVHIGARDVTGRVALRPGAEIAPGQSVIAQLVVDQPVVALTGDRFVLRDQSARRTLGGGRIIDAFAARGRRNPALHAVRLEAMEREDPAAALQGLARVLPQGIDLAHFALSFNLAPESVQSLVASCSMTVLGREPPIALPQASIEKAKSAIAGELEGFHKRSPQKSGMQVAELHKLCAPDLASRTFSHLLRQLAEEKRVEASGSEVRLPRHVSTGNPVDEATWQKVRPELERAGTAGLRLPELAAAARLKEGVLRDFLHRKASTGEVVRVTAERFYLRTTLAQFAAAARELTQAVPQGRFTAAQFRDRTGLGRARAIEILECLDRLRVTQRTGDVRILRNDSDKAGW